MLKTKKKAEIRECYTPFAPYPDKPQKPNARWP